VTRGLIAIDWGSSSLRGARVSGDGAVLEERSFAAGILTVPPGGFAAALRHHFGDWLTAPDTLCLMAGMIGSRQGWIEAPYAACPANAADIARQLTWVVPGRVAIVPGLSCERDGAPDVMRGEETQVFGALQLFGLGGAARVTLVLPGTHSKWVQVERGVVRGFATLMTGEVYALLRHQSILARTLPVDDAVFDEAAFDAGVAHSLRGNGLLGAAFSVRSLSLFERLPEPHRPSYLSGLVIGEELRAQREQAGDRIVLVGSPTLAPRYERALALLGARTESVGSKATWRGLFDIASTLRS
jgi:2-dehydro-3-deoxygalactonokinase